MNRTSTFGRVDEGRDDLNGRVSHVEGSDGRILLLLGARPAYIQLITPFAPTVQDYDSLGKWKGDQKFLCYSKEARR